MLDFLVTGTSVCLFLHEQGSSGKGLLPVTPLLCVLALWSNLAAVAPSVSLKVVYTVLYWCN